VSGRIYSTRTVAAAYGGTAAGREETAFWCLMRSANPIVLLRAVSITLSILLCLDTAFAPVRGHSALLPCWLPPRLHIGVVWLLNGFAF
jgi:hypothetical protein